MEINADGVKDTSSNIDDIDISHIPEEQRPVSKHNLRGAGHFFGIFGGEHVAGTEFIVGATFVAWGVSAFDIFIGLLIGNLLGVLTWALLTAPIAVDTRLTLYAYVAKISGTSMTTVYNLFNAFYFLVNAGAMVTVSASAIRPLFNIPVQTEWYPTNLSFMLLVLVIGLVVAVIAAFGFDSVADFSSVVAPWLAVIFVAGGIVGLFLLLATGDSVSSINGFGDFWTLMNDGVFSGDPNSNFSIWHVIFYAWGGNITHHGAMSDMSIFRFAKKKKYGFISAWGMYFGHYIAWIAAGIFGAAAAIVLNTSIHMLDPGAVAPVILGFSGLLAVVIAGWSTSNPGLYRAGLAVHSVFNKFSLKTVTFTIGVIATIAAMFPYVFSYILELNTLFSALLVPIGMIVVTEHWILPKIGYTRYWSYYKGESLNKAALYTWIISVIFVLAVTFTGLLHVFFVFLPTAILSILLYIFLAGRFGAKESYPEEEKLEQLEQEKLQKVVDEDALENIQYVDDVDISSILVTVLRWTGYAMVAVIGVSALLVYFGTMGISTYYTTTLIATIIYFVVATSAQRRERVLKEEAYLESQSE